MIPFKYNVRNLRVRWKTTLMTVVGTALLVASSCILFGLVEGLEHSLKVSGDPLDLIILRKGATAETTGGFEGKKADELLTLGGILRDADGPVGAKELLNIAVAERNAKTFNNLIIRGVQPASRKLRPDFKIVAGRDFEPGKGECIVSRSIARLYKGGQVGGQLVFGEKEKYRVVGVFTAGGSSAESEVWADLKDVERNTGRDGSVSCVQIRAADPKAFDQLRKDIEDGTQFRLAAIPESTYFAGQSESSLFLKGAGTLIAVLLTFGAMFAAANTMFSAVKSRTREIGTMRALGFSRGDVLFCFLGESVLLSLLGGALGLLATLPMSFLSIETSNFNTFASVTINFRFGPLVMAVALIMTLVMGLFGGMIPALRAVRLEVISALREL
ncbi:ABC transporter permease [Paludisphaera mucosa]|uniref:ABC transporter permease n=1 Tax=Paludisphaera mucosa TaxID=3030827 RepID=A0ABT6FFL6_9BACT|nr:ABC transporter permease [Paludisphaera mucosa]MDG3006190.1 ABC transporter permease [Paludisphaera mucosa]